MECALPVFRVGEVVIHRGVSVGWAQAHQLLCTVADWWAEAHPTPLNPEERLNADLKYAMGSKVPARTKTKLRAAASDHMRLIESSPERVKAYFKDPRVAYAAESGI